MFNTSSFRLADAGIDPKAFARSARDLSLPDPGAMLRSVDVSGRVDAASEAVRGVIEKLPGKRRRRRRLPIVVAALVLGGLAAVGLAWLRRRNALSTTASDAMLDDQAFDAEALDRAANEGMGVATGENARQHSNGEFRELSSVGDPA